MSGPTHHSVASLRPGTDRRTFREGIRNACGFLNHSASPGPGPKRGPFAPTAAEFFPLLCSAFFGLVSDYCLAFAILATLAALALCIGAIELVFAVRPSRSLRWYVVANILVLVGMVFTLPAVH